LLCQRDARVRLAAIVVHDDARHQWKLLQHRAVEQVMASEELPLTCVDFAAECQALIGDFSVYPCESQVGLPADLLDDDSDHPNPVTLHGPKV
jgi:hypothetical protein